MSLKSEKKEWLKSLAYQEENAEKSDWHNCSRFSRN